MKYDYIIIGGGPSGLSIAQLLIKSGKKILLLEHNNSLGGCHRVARVDGRFTEHSPRVLSTRYKNLEILLKDMNTSFSDLFVPYKFKISDIGKRNITSLKAIELFHLTIAFLNLIINENYGSNISMKQFMIEHHFETNSMDYIDRVCRVVDGATSDEFSLNEFLEIANQQAFYPLYQPKQPNDVGFIKYWQNYLETSGIDIKLNTKLTRVLPTENKIITTNGSNNRTIIYSYKKLILALNPYVIYNTLPPSVFPAIDLKYATQTQYLTYISMTFHWNEKLTLPPIQGFSASKWGIVFIVMSDYFENYKGTLVSIAITILNKKSDTLNKTANEISDVEIIKNEAFKQFKESFKGVQIPEPDFIIMYPGAVYTTEYGWTSSTGSFFNSFQNNNTFIPFQSPNYKNIYNLGSQNGYQTYKFTSIESAVSNGIHLAKILEPDFVQIETKSGLTLVFVFRIAILLIAFLLMYLIRKTKLFIIILVIILASILNGYNNK